MKPIILFALAVAALASGCAKLMDIRDQANSWPIVEWVIPDNITERYIAGLEDTFGDLVADVEDYEDLFTAGELADFNVDRGIMAGGLASYRDAMRRTDPGAIEAIEAAELELRQVWPRLRDAWREGAKRYAKQRLIERIGGAG